MHKLFLNYLNLIAIFFSLSGVHAANAQSQTPGLLTEIVPCPLQSVPEFGQLVSLDYLNDCPGCKKTSASLEEGVLLYPYSRASRELKLNPGTTLSNLNRIALICRRNPGFNPEGWKFRSLYTSNDQTLMTVTGIANRQANNLVKAEVTFGVNTGYVSIATGRDEPNPMIEYHNAEAVTLTIEMLETTGERIGFWTPVKSAHSEGTQMLNADTNIYLKRFLHYGEIYTIRLETFVPKDSIFRVRLYTDIANHRPFTVTSTKYSDVLQPNPRGIMYLDLKKASVFGSKCYPDLSNPGNCL